MARLFALLFAVIAIVCSTTAVAAERPNILFIFTDDQSYKTLSCYDEAPDWVSTPNIDALAKAGDRLYQWQRSRSK